MRMPESDLLGVWDGNKTLNPKYMNRELANGVAFRQVFTQ